MLETIKITDTKGRLLEVRLLDALEQLDLFEAAGTNSSNAPWLGMAMMACAVRTIDGVPLPSARTRDQVRNAISKLGTEGIAAVRHSLSAPEPIEVDAIVDQAKN